jgi:FAD/FMN-containing dehydrogenase
VLVEATSSQISESLNEQIMAVLVDAQEKDIVRDALLAQNTTQRELFWRIRETIPEAQTRTGTSIKHDVSVAISDVPRFISEGMARCQAIAPAAALVVYGHLGDGSLHFNAYAPKDWDKPTVQAMTRTLGQAMYELAASYRGSISAEHGIGKFLRDELAQFKNPVAMQVMRAIKQALDPNGIMNPGKVVATL